jgi:hypothetical protein
MNEAIKEAFQQGIKLGPTINKDRYICPETGCHFEFLDMCRRIKICEKLRLKQFPELANMAPNQGKRLNKELSDQQAVQAMRKQQRDSSANPELLSNKNGSVGSKSYETST